MADNVDGINLMEWYCKDNGWGSRKETQAWSRIEMRKILTFVGGDKKGVWKWHAP